MKKKHGGAGENALAYGNTEVFAYGTLHHKSAGGESHFCLDGISNEPHSRTQCFVAMMWRQETSRAQLANAGLNSGWC
jgi:hypothetical protein